MLTDPYALKDLLELDIANLRCEPPRITSVALMVAMQRTIAQIGCIPRPATCRQMVVPQGLHVLADELNDMIAAARRAGEA